MEASRCMWTKALHLLALFFFLKKNNNKFFLFATSTLVVIYAINNDVPFWNSSCAAPVLIIGKNARRKIRREKCPHNLSGTNVYISPGNPYRKRGE